MEACVEKLTEAKGSSVMKETGIDRRMTTVEHHPARKGADGLCWCPFVREFEESTSGENANGDFIQR